MTFRKSDHVQEPSAKGSMGWPPSPEVTGPIPTPIIKPVEETKADKFVRLAEARTKKVLKYIRSLGKLSNSAYDYTEEQIKLICNSIRKEADELERKLRGVKPAQDEFKLR